MRIEPVQSAATGRGHRPQPQAARKAESRAQGGERKPGQARGTALVALNSPQDRASHTTAILPRTASPFLAQLLANSMGLAQTRERRRLGAEEASLRYDAADRLGLAASTGSRARQV